MKRAASEIIEPQPSSKKARAMPDKRWIFIGYTEDRTAIGYALNLTKTDKKTIKHIKRVIKFVLDLRENSDDFLTFHDLLQYFTYGAPDLLSNLPHRVRKRVRDEPRGVWDPALEVNTAEHYDCTRLTIFTTY